MAQEPSPPTRVDPWDLSRDLAKIEQQWPYLREILENPDSFQEVAAEVSQWSSGEHAGHLALGACLMARRVAECLEDSQANLQPEQPDFTELVFKKGGFQRGVGKAPQEMRPEAHTPAVLLAKLDEAQGLWRDLSRKPDRIAASRSTRKHFAFGDLKASDWTRLCALHNAHHLRIVEDIRQASSSKSISQ